MENNHGWNIQQLEEDWHHSHTDFLDEIDPDPVSSFEQNAEYILTQQILKELRSKNPLTANLLNL